MATTPSLPTPVSFDDTIVNLKTLQDSFKPDICTNKTPLIDFAAAGTLQQTKIYAMTRQKGEITAITAPAG